MFRITRPARKPALADPIISQRSPYQFYLLAFGIFLGIAQAFGFQISSAFSKAVGHNVTIAWGTILAVGCFLGLVGIIWRGNPYTGLLVERSGVLLVGGAALAYAVIVAISPNAMHVAYTVSVNFAFGLASIWRANQITRRFRWMHNERQRRANIADGGP